MKKSTIAWMTLLIGLVWISACDKDAATITTDNLSLAGKRLTAMTRELHGSRDNPRSLKMDELVLVKSRDWTSGFFPGCLWLMYEATGASVWKEQAAKFTLNLEAEQHNGSTHDMGFKMLYSFGNGYRLTGDSSYKAVLLQSAKTLITRFNPKVGCIRSWDHHQEVWQYPVIIDNLMNLELLFWATRHSGDPVYHDIARTHALQTMKHHFRKDYSTWHVVNYDSTTGAVINKQTHQGLADESCWARGQAWALYGYTMCYRETGDTLFLRQAEKIAGFILNHPNLPDDLVPYWDFDIADKSTEPRDVSAAAIIGSALFELCQFPVDNSSLYRMKANQILENLSHHYLAKEANYFILSHSVGSKPSDSEVDVPIIYADYYFLEMNLRKMRLDKADVNLTAPAEDK